MRRTRIILIVVIVLLALVAIFLFATNPDYTAGIRDITNRQ